MSRAFRELQNTLKYQGMIFEPHEKIGQMLHDRATMMVNSSPEPPHQILVNRLKLDMAEKERVGLIFNRTVRGAIASRWRYLENLNAQFLQEIVSMEEQIKDDSCKCEREVKTFLADRAHILALRSQLEQMMGAVMHITFYKEVLQMRIESLQNSAQFLQKCSENLSFNHPMQVIDRYESLKLIFEELFHEFEERANVLNALQEEYNEITECGLKRNMLYHLKMGDMYEELKARKNENMELEKSLTSKLEHSSNTAVIGYKVKIAIRQIYLRMMEYRGLEPVETNPIRELSETEYHIKTSDSVIHIVKEGMMNDFRKKKQKQNKKALDAAEKAAGRIYSFSSFISDSKKSSEDQRSKTNTCSSKGDSDQNLRELVRQDFSFKNKRALARTTSLLDTVKESKSKEKITPSTSQKDLREMKPSGDLASDVGNQPKSPSEELDSVTHSVIEVVSEKASVSNIELDKSNSRKIGPETLSHNSIGCPGDINMSKNIFRGKAKCGNWSTSKIKSKNRNMTHRTYIEYCAPTVSGSKNPRHSSTCKQIETTSYQEIKNYHLEKVRKGDLSLNRSVPNVRDFKHSRVVTTKTKPAECTRPDARELPNILKQDDEAQTPKSLLVAQLSDLANPTKTSKRSNDLTMSARSFPINKKGIAAYKSPKAIKYPGVLRVSEQSRNEVTTSYQQKCFSKEKESSGDTKSTRSTAQRKSISQVYNLPLMTTAHRSSTLKRFALKTENPKLFSGSMVGKREKILSFNKLDTVATKPVRPVQGSNLSEKRRSSCNFPSFGVSKGKNKTLVKSQKVTSLPDMFQRQKSFAGCVPSKPTRSRLESRRLLGELCASRRSLRDNCLNILAAVDLHPQRAHDVAGHENS